MQGDCKMDKTIYVTTSIPYVNSRPHIGFALELVQADVIARYHRLLGNGVYFQTGTDDNAFKNVLSAREEGIPIQRLVDRNSGSFKDLLGALNISADNFVRTSGAKHKEAVSRLWGQFKHDDLYTKRYRGLYCTGCEDFYLEKDLANGRCPDHGTRPLKIEEENYFFRLSDYQRQITDLLNTDRVKIVPQKRKNEILQFINTGLHDISISRDSDRMGGWGIQVPGDASQTIYVWVDALTNYISGIGYGTGSKWQGVWNESVQKTHVIGKNVWKFHAILWLAMLLSAELPLPDEILIHGFVTENSQKISKSRGSSIDPFAYVKQYGADAIRYYLLRVIPPFDDGDFSSGSLKQTYNSDLANDLGNLVSRLTALSEKAGLEAIDPPEAPLAPENYHEHLNAYDFRKALLCLWNAIGRINKDIDLKKPWETLRKGNRDTLSKQLASWSRELHSVVYWLAPFLPDASRRATSLLSDNGQRNGHHLFPRID